MTADRIDHGALSEQLAEIVTVAVRQDEIVLVGHGAELGIILQIAFDALHPEGGNERLLGQAGALFLEIGVEVLVKVVDKTEMVGYPHIVVEIVGVFQLPVLRNDIAAVGHDVGSEDHGSGSDPEDDADEGTAFVLAELS